MKKTITLLVIALILALILGCAQEKLKEEPVESEAQEMPEEPEQPELPKAEVDTLSETIEPTEEPDEETSMLPEAPVQKLLPGEEEPGSEGGLPYVQISIDKAGFDPKEVVVEKGTTVVFTNEVNRMSSLQIYTLGDGYKTINSSGRLLENDSFNHTFNEPGEFGLREIILNFRGSITVE